ncbi:DUF948 domain-containing protein [Almyronema epifaneia]|uniref:DUF948 domain-containing protein n=1 Tax=Almyronema epifaneia S1 TaxID=2991925 RepID=A0ABW6IHH4_9CYAN
MADPLLWLGLSILLLAMSLTAMMLMALPALRELAKAARSAERLFETLNQELPPTLEALRLTGAEIAELTDGMSDGIYRANHMVKQVDQSLYQAHHQAKQAEHLTRSFWVGCKAAWKTFTRSPQRKRSRRQAARQAQARQKLTRDRYAHPSATLQAKAATRDRPNADSTSTAPPASPRSEAAETPRQPPESD